MPNHGFGKQIVKRAEAIEAVIFEKCANKLDCEIALADGGLQLISEHQYYDPVDEKWVWSDYKSGFAAIGYVGSKKCEGTIDFTIEIGPDDKLDDVYSSFMRNADAGLRNMETYHEEIQRAKEELKRPSGTRAKGAPKVEHHDVKIVDPGEAEGA